MALVGSDRSAWSRLGTHVHAALRALVFPVLGIFFVGSLNCSPGSPAAGSSTAGSAGGSSSGASSSAGSSGSPASGSGGATTDWDATISVDSAGAAAAATGAPDATTGLEAGCAGSMTVCGGSCVDLTTNAANCGACGAACPGGQVCQKSACGCPPGASTCAGQCVDAASDAKNCGACGKACPAAMVCSQGACASGCAGLLTACAGSCVDTSGSALNCGSCGHACVGGQSCWMGACRCPTGQDACGANGQCVDVTMNALHCGTCSNACATGAACTSSACSCPAGQTACSGACVNLNTDPKNCGACGTECTTAGTQCLDGACINPTSVHCGGGAMSGYSCTSYASTLLGQYWVNNNEWGVVDGGTSGQQCIWGTCQTGDLVGWGTSWNWTAGNGQVKTYASLVFGWQWGWKVTNTGLPVQISANHAVNCGWDFTVSQNGTLDISYDTWLHSIANPGYADTPSEEVMIWLYYAGGAGPIGPTIASGISIAGATWDLHQGQASGWPVSSYVRTSNATTAVMDLMAFYKDLVSRGWIPNTRYLTGVQTGTEVFTGTGTLTTNGFYCRIQ